MKTPLPPERHSARVTNGVQHPQVLRNAGRKLLRQINKWYPRVLNDDDPECMHRLRVAVRQLRVLLALVRRVRDTSQARQAASALKWLAQALGPARDSDVFLYEIWPALRTDIGGSRLLSMLDAAWTAQRNGYYRMARRALATPRFRALCVSLNLLFAAPAPGKGKKDSARSAARFAREALHRRVRRVHRRYARARNGNPADDHALHRLRIEIKKLRYELGFLAPLLQEQRVMRATDKLARLQDTLGEMNDLAAAQFQVTAALRQGRGAAVERVRRLLASRRETRAKSLHRALRRAWTAYQRVLPLR